VGQRSVEILIGRLVTDEGLRERFIADPRGTLRLAQQQSGLELNATEIDALLCSPVTLWVRLSALLDPRLQKANLKNDRGDRE